MRFKRPLAIIAVVVMALLVVSVTPFKVARADDDESRRLEAVPFTFVGLAAGCAPSPPGSRIVTSAWLNGFGLPDNGGPNTSESANDPHSGLLLSKNGLTTDCSAAGVRITGAAGMS